jgi:sugar O-acyltransferase (sialic acid O-acetyltransferase NeuD family)
MKATPRVVINPGADFNDAQHGRLSGRVDAIADGVRLSTMSFVMPTFLNSWGATRRYTLKSERTKLVLFGSGMIAEVIYWYLKDSPYEVVGFTVDKSYVDKESFFGLPLEPFESIEKIFPPAENKMFIAVSYREMNRFRAEKYRQAKEKGYQLVSYVSPKAMVWDNVEMGDNCFIFEANVIQPFVKIGCDTIMWSGNHIGHHTTIGDHCFIASHAVVSGHVTVGNNCFIGVNATIREGVKIPNECLIGANALIVKDAVEKGVYGGHPATLLRTG